MQQMRATYETELDRKREKRLAEVVAANIQSEDLIKAARCPRYYPCDWVLYRVAKDNPVHSLLEAKVRSRRYPRYMLSLSKASNIVHQAAFGGVGALLSVYWEDEREVGIVDLMSCSREAGFSGRRDRGDWQDVEPVIYIPTSEFTIIKPGVFI